MFHRMPPHAVADVPKRTSATRIRPGMAFSPDIYSYLLCVFLLLAAAAPQAGSGPAKQNLFPRLQPGQSLAYLIRFRNDKQIKTQSTVVAPMAPNGAQIDAHGLLLIDVLDVQPAGTRSLIHARSRFQALDSGVWLKHPAQKEPDWETQRATADEKFIEFTILTDGSVKDMKGLDALFPEQQQAWQEWITQFAIAGVFPKNGINQGEKWKSEAPEKSSSPIAGLQWLKEGTYVRDEPCTPMRLNIQGEAEPSDQPAETCAVVLTRASLKQKSSVNDATPEDYKLHNLHTKGVATGTNEVITYISLKTGLVVRATEEANQFMDVSVAMSDGSNRVHYNVDAKSHAEILLVTETPLTHP
jgi:hypothetical protein